MNERLERTSSEAERNRILLETLTGSYDDAADAFYRNNEQLVQARKNQAALSAMTAKLGNASAIAKNSLMRLFGVQEDGSIRAGSALAWLNDRAESLLAKFQEWSQDGTMDALAQKLDQGLARGAELASQGFQWLRENGDTLLAVLKPLAGAIVGLKLMKLTTDTVKVVRDFGLFAQTVGLVTKRVLTNGTAWIHNTADMALNKAGLLAHTVATKAAAAGTTLLAGAQKLLNLAFVQTPVGWVVLGIMTLVAAGVALYKNWDKVKAKAGELWDGIKTVFGGIKDSIVGAFNSAKEAVGSFFSWIGDKLSALDGAIESVPVIGSIYRGIKGAGSWVIDKVTGHATGTQLLPRRLDPGQRAGRRDHAPARRHPDHPPRRIPPHGGRHDGAGLCDGPGQCDRQSGLRGELGRDDCPKAPAGAAEQLRRLHVSGDPIHQQQRGGGGAARGPDGSRAPAPPEQRDL